MINGAPVSTTVVEPAVASVAISLDSKIAIANCALTAILLVVTIVSVVYAFLAYDHQKKRLKKDAACDLAKYYAQNIIKKYTFLNYIFVLSGLEEEIKVLFPYDRIKSLSKNEMIGLLDEQGESYESISTKMMYVDPVVIFTAKIRDTKSIEERHLIEKEYLVAKLVEDESDSKCSIAHADILTNEYYGEITMLLNDLEWFAMSCRYGLADEEMLYQSLHQTYISNVWRLYYFICRNNASNQNKLYTNLIWLFNTWKDRLHELQESGSSNRMKAEQDLAQAELERIEAERKIERAKNRIENGGPNEYAGSVLK